jgi:kumamolisin
LVAVANQQLGTQVGFLQPAIYAAKAASAFNDITQGNNGAFSAGPGWDACTGLGSPIAGKLIPLLAASGTPTQAPTPPATPPKKKKKKKSASAPIATKKAAKRTVNKVGKKLPVKKASRKKK